MAVYLKKPDNLKETGHKFCPGCLHGVATRLVGEVAEELGITDRLVGVIAVGCANLSQLYFDFDLIGAAHGRSAAVASGFKRMADDDVVVMSYQGDGDLASIGIAETIHAANRGENITVIFINNGIYGMTGGQMAPTTLEGQYSTTTQSGRNPESEGYPIGMCEVLSQLKAPEYVARFSLHSPKCIMDAKKGIKKAFENQMERKGYSFVELLSNCPTNWKLSPLESINHMKETVIPNFPLGEFVNHSEGDR